MTNYDNDVLARTAYRTGQLTGTVKIAAERLDRAKSLRSTAELRKAIGEAVEYLRAALQHAD